MTPEQLVARYQARYGRLRAETVRRVLAAWDAYGGVSDANADRFIAAVVPIVEGAEVATAGLTAGYIAAMVGASPVAVPAAAVTTGALRGVPTAEVYLRAIIAARAASDEGLGAALAAGRRRAEQLAGTDLALAQREATRHAISGDGRIVGYRRVLTGRSCAFCATASTQRYRREDLMPIHAGCDCGVAPIFGSADPGRVINRKLVADLKAAARTSGDRDYWQSRHLTVDEDGTVLLPEVAVRRHGELGPVLGAKAHAFTGPGDLAA